MNITYNYYCAPLRVLLVNPISDTGAMICMQACRGVIFGIHQMIDLILLVYSNEINEAEKLKVQLELCGLPCKHSITITCNLPSISDADVFIFVTNFPSPNSLDFDKLDDDTIFDSLYLLLKIANNFEMPPPVPPEEEKLISIRKRHKLILDKPRRPIIIADGLIALDILKTFTKNIPNDIFFCPTPIAAVAKSILGDYLKVPCNELNHVFVWAANDDIFHVDVEMPVYRKDKPPDRSPCTTSVMSDVELEHHSMDFTQFNAMWLKKDFVDKIAAVSSHHPNRSIYKTAKIRNLLQDIWKTRSSQPKKHHRCNCGVISDGSLDTTKGLPYFLPIIFENESFVFNHHKKDDFHVKQEINRINKAVRAHHKKLIRYCSNFLEKNVIKKEFLLSEDDSTSAEISSFTSLI